MTPEERTRAALAPKSAEDSRATNEMVPPPGTGRPVPQWTRPGVTAETSLGRTGHH